MKCFVALDKLRPGDTVAVVSPSAGLPGLFPWVQDAGLEQLRQQFGLVPVEYPSTRQMGASYAERARDVMAAFANPDVKAVLSSVGGDDEIGLIKYLDPAVFLTHPKPYFGYSDNTNLHNFLWNLGIPSFYGCSTLVQLAMPGGMHDLTVRSLCQALFGGGDYEVEASAEYTDIDLDWADPANLDRPRLMEPNSGLYWDGEGEATGILWGGCCESLFELVAAGQHLPADEDLGGAVFFMETSQLIPEPFLVRDLLTAFGERGWLSRFSAILVGRPKAWEFSKPNDAAAKAAYRQTQRETVIKAVRAYNPRIPIVQNLDFGHTDPQIIIPNGGQAKISTAQRRIVLSY